MYGTDIGLIHAFFPGFGKPFLERKLKKIDRISKKSTWNSEEDLKLISLLYHNEGSFQTIATQFTGRTLQGLVERFNDLKADGTVKSFLESVKSSSCNKNQVPSSLENIQMAEEDPAVTPEMYQKAINDGVRNDFDFTFDPFGGQVSTATDPFGVTNFDSKSKIGSFQNVFGGTEGSMGELYGNQISQIFRNEPSQGGEFVGEAQNNDMTQEATDKSDVNAFLDMNNSEGSIKHDDNSDSSPRMQLNVRHFQPETFDDMM